MSQGTYVGLRALHPSSERLVTHARQDGLKLADLVPEKQLHTTVIYSRKHCPRLVASPLGTVHEASFVSYDVFNTSSGGKRALVIKLSAPSVVARHLQLMAEHGATYDFPTFQPHVTLCYDYRGDLSELTPINFPIYLGEEYVEDLHLD